MTSKAAGRVWRRCGCRREDGTKWGAACPRLSDPKHGAWSYRLDLGYGEDGRRREKSKHGYETEEEARVDLAREIVARADGRLRYDKNMTVRKYLTQWVDDKIADGELRPSTANTYARYVRLDLAPSKLGKVRLSELRTSHVKELMRDLRKAGRGEPTIRQIVAVLKSAMTTARQEGLIFANPVDLKLGASRPSKVRPWEPEELGEFLDGIAGHRLAPLFELLAFTGLRRGEALGLRWADVDLARGRLTVRRQLVAVGGRAQEGKPKTRSGEDRPVDLSEHMVGVLLTHQLAQQEEREAWGDRYLDGDRVFATEDGRDLDPGWVSKEFHRLVARAGLRPIRLHDLRHLNASLMLLSGTSMTVVSKQLGHSSVRVTNDLYTHLIGGVGRAAADAAAALVPRVARTPALAERPGEGWVRAPMRAPGA